MAQRYEIILKWWLYQGTFFRLLTQFFGFLYIVYTLTIDINRRKIAIFRYFPLLQNKKSLHLRQN